MKPLVACIIIGGVGLLAAGCTTSSDLSQEAFTKNYTAGSEFHPEGARLNRNKAIQLGVATLERQGFRTNELANPGALYIGPTRGMLGVRHKDWIITFKNNSASAYRYPSLGVYVDDRNGKTEVVQKGAHP
jgi:hypothetical protein